MRPVEQGARFASRSERWLAKPLRVTGSGATWQVSGDTNGNKGADFLTVVTALVAPIVTDFLL